MQDDTTIEDANMREQATLELMKSQVDKVWSFDELELSKDNKDWSEGDYCFVNISKECAEAGYDAGVEFAKRITKTFTDPVKIVLMFEGYANDPRPLFLVPDVIMFCRGVLSVEEEADRLRTQHLLGLLVDEEEVANEGIFSIEDAYQITGSAWLCAHAFPQLIFFKDETSPTGYSRNVHSNLILRRLMMSGHVDDGDYNYMMTATSKFSPEEDLN